MYLIYFFLLVVPWPGTSWLDRISLITTSPSTPSRAHGAASSFTWKDATYSSVYAALLDNQPLRFPCRNFNAYLNSVFISNESAAYLVQMTGSLEVAHYIMCYIRNFIGAMIVYYGTAGIFHYFCYVHPIAKQTFAHRVRPSASTIWNQISLAQASLFLYVLLPVVDEYAVEQGWTQTYHTVSEIGGYPWYFGMMIVYFALVEIGIYWMHRTLHTNKWLYKYIHMKHHQYNKPETLTPWASIAFHPLDGILQASPYFMVMFVIPCHYLTHVVMLFFTAIWATYIHDAMDWNIDPIMGSKYHTVHHTHYIYNYGQVFTFCDRIWGTLRVPLEPTGGTKQRFLKVD
jgi:Delta7-sterol 5-desaturase